ncbi:winged helix-turn-helix transcriptional regulator [Deinococcus budaensis]|uniref:DNA-binding HxlR family transcriptional regulator n=1 Tax=Deinococcus budaensis TaxID=1665626 RepID=A0A7W8GH86_9DEIO|nr:helix-turn-helix domain-containing protein [Deinococcus budaensis]MBB5235438.1 DNA-binding HxlR family transcriptional regulator [Deinococcus budaensis]
MSRASGDPFSAAFHHATDLVGKRWTGAILFSLFHGRTRFSELAAAVPGLSGRLLSERLKEFEAEGLLTRTVTPETPVRITYHLTAKGRALGGVLRHLDVWAQTWLTPGEAPNPVPEA